MRVLLTNNTLGFRAGSELYVRDVATELMRRGHHPVAYSTVLGAVADELKAATVPVINRLDSLGEPPDIIHGQHHYETLSAMLRFPHTPAIYYCHGWLPYEESPLHFPRIARYVAVDELCRERLITEGGISSDRIELLLNFFDARLFPPRPPLPLRPKLALAFSNGFYEDSDLPLLREACAQCGIELHAVGLAMQKSESDPGQLLQNYDLVFAKARAAIEAMAVGAAVILCHPGRLGTLVTPDNFGRLRSLNFGIRTLDRPLKVNLLVSEINRYNAATAAQVSAVVREQCELQSAADRLIALYESVIQEARQAPLSASVTADQAAARHLEQHSSRYKGLHFEADRDRWIKLYHEAIADRDRWSQRCLAAERDRDSWSSRTLAAEAEHQAWSERCLLSEADRDRWSERCLNAEADLGAWSTRCLAAETERDALRPYASLPALHELALQQLETGWQNRLDLLHQQWQARHQNSEENWSSTHARLLHDLHLAESQCALAQRELAGMRNWFAWRILKGILESFPMRSLIRPTLRAMRKQWRSVFARDSF